MKGRRRIAGEAGLPWAGVSFTDLMGCLVPRSVHPEFALGTVRCRGQERRVDERVMLVKPFCRLKMLRRESAAETAGVLVVAPLSGQYATLLRDTVAGLLSRYCVYITDWSDARDVPLADGSFDLAANISYVLEFLRALPPPLHVVAVCQSAVPALAAAALLAAAGDVEQPRSLILMGGLVDTRVNPTRIDHWAKALSFQWLERAVIRLVPPGYPGFMRPVYPAEVQQLALLAYLGRHVRADDERPGQFRVTGDATLAEPVFRRELLTLMDVPAELFLSNVRAVLRNHDLPRGRLLWEGHIVEPAAIEGTALMTVEGEFDDISGRGQTHAAHGLCRSIPPDKRRHHVQRGVGHFGMYAGRTWFKKVLPQVVDFIEAQS
jgi:poly(3-hydroxybutyrate) depolymerase